MKLSITATLAALAFGSHAHGQGFLTNCTWQTAMFVDSYLGAYCNNNNWKIYSYDWTWFDTSHCLMNSNGQLSPSDSGDYWRSCKGCTARPTQNDFTINCTCLVTGVSGVRVTVAAYDLNRIVWNHDGYLGCFGHFGNKSERGPF